MTTERRFLHSTLAAYGSQIGRLLIRAAGDLVLARLILPAGHGVFDLALGVVTVASIFRDLGLPYQLVRDERRPYGAVFLWVTSAGALLAAAIAMGAPLFAPLDPGLPAVLRVYALWVLLDGLAVVPKLYFERELAVSKLVAPEILRGLAIAVVAIALAATGAGVWSLVAGELVGAALFAALLWWRARGHLKLDIGAAGVALLPGLLARSNYLFLIALAALPVPYVARFILGSFAGAATVAQYGKARDWGFKLQALVLPAVARVLYPALVEYKTGDRRRFLAAYRLGTVTILALETLAAYFLFWNARIVLLQILIGHNWGPAVPLLRILCFVPLTDPFSRLGGEVLKVEGEDRAWFVAVATNFVSLLLFGILFTRAWGATGLAWAQYLLLGNWLLAWRVYLISPEEFWRLSRDLLFLYMVPLPLFLLAGWLCPADSWALFAASLVAAGVAAVVYAARFWRPVRALFAPAA
jgi:O-antigen/teichoic acid export membrane protein